ncbi:hypothetical protein [Kitasatospora sp. NPDC056731]|uniref:hypothetical protein n=1 Tax=Kitasatospora sp. NPDC056731 TaxID=3155422 RepID=UPI003420F21E
MSGVGQDGRELLAGAVAGERHDDGAQGVRVLLDVQPGPEELDDLPAEELNDRSRETGQVQLALRANARSLRQVPDGGHGCGEDFGRDRTPAAEPVQVLAALVPDTRPLPTTTAYDELLPSRRTTRPKALDGPESTPGEAGRQTTDATTIGAKPDPIGDGIAGAQQAGEGLGLAAVEGELVAAAQALVGDLASGLSKAVDRQLYRQTAALARGEDMLLPHLCHAIADLAGRRSRLRLPDTPEGRRLRTALAAYESAWNTTGSGTVMGPQDVSSRAHP